MSRRIRRPHMISAVMLTTLAAATGCTSVAHHAARQGTTTTPSTQPTQSPPAGTSRAAPPAAPHTVNQPGAGQSTYNPNVPTVANGTSTVTIGGQPVRFRSTVTDASWSPDGSRLVYVDGNGNIATARADGTDVVVLTQTNSKVKRAHPTWESAAEMILFTERGADGVWRLTTVASNAPSAARSERQVYINSGTSSHDTAPNAVAKLDATTGQRSVDLVTYQHAGKKGPEVWVLDWNQREPVPAKVAAGTDPTLSPDGRSIAFVGAGGQLFVEMVVGGKAKMPIQLTRGVAGVSHPAWSPDGARIAFRTKTNVESVSAKPRSGSKTGPTRVESRTSGSPTYRPQTVTPTYRVDDSDPIAAAISLSRARWATPPATGGIGEGEPRWTYVVTLIDTSDLGGALGYMQAPDGPVLFVYGNSLDPRVKAEIRRLLGSYNRGVNLFGHVSPGVAAAVKSMGYTVTRPVVEGPGTEAYAGAQRLLVVSDRDLAAVANYPRALNATSAWSVMFVHGDTLTELQRYEINSLASKPTVYALGNDAVTALSKSWSGRPKMNLVRVASTDPSTESLRMLKAFGVGPTCVALAPTTSWQRQLLASTTPCAVLLVDPRRGLSAAAAEWLRASAGSVATVYVFGGTGMISDASVDRAAAAISGPGGYAHRTLPRPR